MKPWLPVCPPAQEPRTFARTDRSILIVGRRSVLIRSIRWLEERGFRLKCPNPYGALIGRGGFRRSSLSLWLLSACGRDRGG